jgi:hypothetical protein
MGDLSFDFHFPLSLVANYKTLYILHIPRIKLILVKEEARARHENEKSLVVETDHKVQPSNSQLVNYSSAIPKQEIFMPWEILDTQHDKCFNLVNVMTQIS